MNFEPPKKLLENLDGGEILVTGIKNARMGAKPNYFFLTDRRIIYFDEKHLGRYDLSSIPFSKLLEMRAQIGPIRFGSLTIASEEGPTNSLNKIPKGSVEPFVEALETAINAIAVEPISINVKKSFTGKSWTFTKPPEMLFRSIPQTVAPVPTSAVPVSDDPLKALQMRLVKGEITKDQYEDMKRYLEGS